MKAFIAILINLAAVFYEAFAQQVLQVSDSPLFPSRTPTGSLRGGAVFYIKGSGFDTMDHDNQVFVGSFPCVINEYFTSTSFIACQMPQGNYGDTDVSLNVMVYIMGNQYTCASSSNCVIKLTYEKSPNLKAVIPQATVAGTNVSLVGYFMSSSTDKIRSIKIGNYNCIVPEEMTKSLDSYNQYTSFSCYAPPDITPSDYNLTVTASEGTGLSNAFVASMNYKVGATQDSFNIRIHPALNSLSSNQGFVNGQIVTLYGNGFGDDPSKVTVDYRDLNCKVLKVSNDQIQCELQADSGAALPVSFIGGAGLEHRFYNSNYNFKNLQSRANYPNNDSPLVNITLTTELIWNAYYFTQRWSGLFYAPVDGNYTFYLSSDDQSSVRISSTPFDPTKAYNETSLVEICSQASWNPFRYFHMYSTQKCTVTLQGSKHYYLLVFHNQGVGPEHISLGVTIPNTDATKKNTKAAVKKLYIQNTPVREVVSYKISKAISGSYKILFYAKDANNKVVVNSLTGNITYNADASTVSNAVRSATGYNIAVTKVGLTSTDQETTVEANVVAYKYLITFNSYRSPQPLPFLITTDLIGTIQWSANQDVAPSAPIQGTFAIQVGSYKTGPINIWSSGYDIQYILSKLTPFAQGVTATDIGDANDGKTWYITLDSIKDNPDFTIVDNLVTGGPNATPAQILVDNNYDPPSNDLYFMPIPSDLLYTFAPTPEFRVKVGNYYAACITRNCGYSLLPANTSPVIESFSFTGSDLTITLASGYDTLPDAAALIKNNLSVTFSKSSCAIKTVALPTITCTMPTNTNGSLNVAAGSFVPKVHLINRGYFTVSASTTKFNLAVNTVNPVSGSIGGNTPITLTGTGFSSDTTVTVNGGPCIITSVSNIQIVCLTPAQNSTASGASIVVTEGTEVTTLTSAFSYSAASTPTITALSKSSSSPVLKSTLDITASNLGTVLADLDVVLIGAKKDGTPVQLPCTPQSINGNILKCVLGGGPAGDYRIFINKKNDGRSIANPADANKFSYVITVTSVTPTVGSKLGGQVITITGSNFSSILNQNQVVINEVMCEIISATSTQIQAIVPALPSTAETFTYDIFVIGRIVETATCDPSVCTFTYTDANTPTVTDMTPSNGNIGTSVTITGTKLNNPAIIIKLGDVSISNVSSQNDTSITFTIPSTPAFLGKLSVSVPGMGNAKIIPDRFFENVFSVSDISVTTGSRGGNYLTINGNGFDASNATVSLSSSPCSITTITTTSITCWFENLSNYGTNYNVYVAQRGANKTCSTCTFVSLQLTNTPIISTISTTSFTTPDSISFIIAGSLLGDGTNAVAQLISRSNAKKILTGSSSFNANNLILTFTNVPVGTYKLVYNISNVGFARVTASTPDISVGFDSSDFTTSAVQVSYAGGLVYTMSGKGLLNTSEVSADSIQVCNVNAKVVSSSYNSLSFTIPQLVTSASNQAFKLVGDGQINPKTITSSDTYSALPSFVNDGNFTSYYSSGSNSCWVKFDFGLNFIAQISKIRLFPYTGSSPSGLTGALIQGSNDDVTWTTLVTIPKDIVLNWNSYLPPTDTPNLWQYRFIRFTGNGCRLAEFNVFGIVTRSGSDTGISEMCDIFINMGSKNVTFTNMVEYRQDKTPSVSSISPALGTTAGGTVLTIAGSGFDPATTTVVIDGINCPVNAGASTTTSLKCTTGPRPNYVAPSIVITTINGLASIGTNTYLYIDRWSDLATWNGESWPREGDSVYVPVGQHLLIDMTPPKIYSLIVEGSIMFEDAQDLEFHADFITVRGGVFQIGTEQNPHLHKLKITMYGTRESKQLPGFGNKNIAVHNGKIDIHGAPKTPSWTLLEASVTAGTSTIVLRETVNWSVGDEIVVASTTFNRDEFERRFITSIAADSKTLTLDRPLDFAHFAETLSYNGTSYEVRAEVAVLTRNVRVVGDPTTDQTHYGAHIMIMGTSGVVQGRFSNLEMDRCGQAFMMGRYPIHFHMIGNVIGSYVKNCSIHDSNNRGTTIHGVHYLTLMNNVYLNHMGHGIFIEDSIETNNVIEGNLIMRTSKSASLLISDLKPAAIWITRPKNYIRNNHAAGSTHFGFWFDLPGNPTGPSATTTICPSGEALGQFTNNTAHSNGIGLRVYPIYIPRTNPCGEVASGTLADPFSGNPSVIAEFTNNLFFANGQGFFGRNIGAIQLKNTAFISNAINAVVAEPESANPFVPRIEDSIMVGRVNSWYSLQGVQSYGAFRTGRKDGFLLKNIEFIDFSSDSFILTTCEGCDDELHRDIGARQTRFEKLKFTNVNARMIQYNDGQRDKDLFEDKDGSLIKKLGVASSTGGWVVPYFKYLEIPECPTIVTDTSICSEKCLICDNTIQFRRVILKMDGSLFDGLDLKVLNYQINNTMNVDDNFSVVKFRSVTKLNFKGWALPFASSYKYNIHWSTGLDFNTLFISNNFLHEPTDTGFYLRTNNTYERELYDGSFAGINAGTYVSNLNVSSLAVAPTAANDFPDFYYTSNTNTSIIRVDGNRIGTFSFTSVICRFNCPKEPVPVAIDSNIRYWSNPQNWTSLKVPVAGDLVVIEDGWNMILDVDTPLLEKLTIKGQLVFANNITSLTLRSKNIDITSGGILQIGNSTNPYDKKATIVLEGDRTNAQIILDPIITPATKSIVVKGKLHVYGQPKTPVNTRLKQEALVGSSTIYVTETTNWAVGDELVISASSRNPTEVDYVTITAILSDSSFTVSPPLLYNHYGANAPMLTKGKRTLDMRAEVSVINRNVVIKGNNNNNWGCRILVAGYDVVGTTPVQSIQGQIDLNYAEVNYCGQKDSEQAAIDMQGLITNTQRIVGSSIRNGIAWGMNIQNSQYVLIDNNIITNQTKTGVQMKNSKNIVFQNNVITKINNRTDYSNVEFLDLIIGFYYNTPGTLQQNNVTIKNNIISSTSWFSWAVPGYNCNEESYNFFNNTGHSSRAGWFGLRMNTSCMKYSDFIGYWNFDEGFAHRFLVPKLIVTRMLVADNNNSISLNGGDPSDPMFPVANITHSEVFGQVLKDCSFCYKTKESCQSSGIYTSLFELTNFVMEFEENRLPLHNVTDTDFLWGGVENIISVNFSDFRTTDVCSHSFAIRANNFIQDTSAYVRLSYVNFTNVDYNNTIFFFNHTRPKNSGFCAKRDCTGIYNLIVSDTTGGIFGSPKTFFGFNKPAGRDGNCTFEPGWNGHACNQVYSLLSMQQPAQARPVVITPITVTLYNGLVQNVTDDLQYSNTVDNERKIPMVVKKFGYHNINIQGTMPNNVIYKLDSELPTDWVILRIQHIDPSTLITLVNDVQVSPKIVNADDTYDFTNTKCGDYVFFPGNRTIIFKVTAEPSCLVKVQVTTALQLSLHINIPPADFYKSGGATTFLDRMSALLGIPTERIRIVGIFNGSTIVKCLVLPPADPVATTSSEPVSHTEELQKLQDKLSSKIADGSADFGGSILDVSFAITTAPVVAAAAANTNNSTTNIVSVCRFNSTKKVTLMDIKMTEMNLGTVDIACQGCTNLNQCDSSKLIQACNQNSTALGVDSCAQDAYCPSNCTQYSDFSYCSTQDGSKGLSSLQELCKNLCVTSQPFNFSSYQSCNYTSCNLTCSSAVKLASMLVLAILSFLI